MKLILYPYILKEPSEEGNLIRTDIKGVAYGYTFLFSIKYS